MTQQTKSQELAAWLLHRTNIMLQDRQAADHILAQEAEIEQLKADLKAEFDGSAALRQQHGAKDTETMFAFVARVAAERDQARDALRVAVEAMENIVSDYDNGTGQRGMIDSAIKQAKEALK